MRAEPLRKLLGASSPYGEGRALCTSGVPREYGVRCGVGPAPGVCSSGAAPLVLRRRGVPA